MNKDLHILNAKLKATLHTVDAFSDAARAASEVSRRSMGWPGLSQTWGNDDDTAARKPKLQKKELESKSWSDFLSDLASLFKDDSSPSIPSGEPNSWSEEDAEGLIATIENTLTSDSIDGDLLNDLNEQLFEYVGSNPEDQNAAEYLELLNSDEGLGNPDLQKNVSDFVPVDITDSTIPNDFEAAVDNFAEFEKDLNTEEYQSRVSDLLDQFDQLSPSQKDAAEPVLKNAFPDPNSVTDPRTDLSVKDAIDVSMGGRGDGDPEREALFMDSDAMEEMFSPSDRYPSQQNRSVQDTREEFEPPIIDIPGFVPEPELDNGNSGIPDDIEIIRNGVSNREQEEANTERARRFEEQMRLANQFENMSNDPEREAELAEQQRRFDEQQRRAQEFEDMDSGSVSQENQEELQRRSERMQRAAQESEDAQPQERLAYDVSKLVEMDQGSDSSDPKRETFNNQLADILDGIEGEPPAAADTLRRRLRNDFPDIENFIDPRTGNEISESPGFGDDQD